MDLGLDTLHNESNDVVLSMDNLAELNPRLLVPLLVFLFCLQLVSNYFFLSQPFAPLGNIILSVQQPLH